MVKVLITKQSNYPVKSSVIKRKLADFLVRKGIVSKADVSIALVGEKRMLRLSSTYLKDKTLHNVLSFLPSETGKRFVFPPDGTIHLGEVVVCYPKAVSEANEENVLVDEKVYELVEHGAMHLLGIHHKE